MESPSTSELMAFLDREDAGYRQRSGNHAMLACEKGRWAMIRALRERLQYDACRIADLMEDAANARAEVLLMRAEAAR